MIDERGRQPMSLDDADSERLDFDRLLNDSFNQNKNETLHLISAMKKSKRPIKAAEWKEFFGQSCYRNCREDSGIILAVVELLECRHYTQEAIDVIAAEMNELLRMVSMNVLELPEETLIRLRATLQRLPEEQLAWMVSERGYDGKKVMKLRSSWSGFGWRLLGLLWLSSFAADCLCRQSSDPFYFVPGMTFFILCMVLFMGIFVSLVFVALKHTVKIGAYWVSFLHFVVRDLRKLRKKCHLRKEILCEKYRKAGWKKALILLALTVFFVCVSLSYDDLWVRLKDDHSSYRGGIEYLFSGIFYGAATLREVKKLLFPWGISERSRQGWKSKEK